ncbi:hypothetical protein LTR28_003522 [Elasticomyces elasticus]|nr:hypothetical protein LTR28_003522 [Elasticomyces elasticus]
MGSHLFKWYVTLSEHRENTLYTDSLPEHPAQEVYVTGTFDNWSKSVKLDKKGDTFEKLVNLPSADAKILYKVRDAVRTRAPWQRGPAAPAYYITLSLLQLARRLAASFQEYICISSNTYFGGAAYLDFELRRRNMPSTYRHGQP